MSREVHVWFWESLKGKFLWATHLGGAACEGRSYPDGPCSARDPAMKQSGEKTERIIP